MTDLKDRLPIDGIKNIKSVGGGDVNDAYLIEAEDDLYFMLIQSGKSEDFYYGEIAGLKLFEEIGVTAPRVVANGQIDKDAYLIITYLDEGSYGSQSELAELVAKMHKKMSPNGKFGFDYPHGGSDTSFTNEYSDTWFDIIVEQRLDVLADMLIDMGLWNDNKLSDYQKVRDVIKKELKNHKSEPSLLHGDLWGGNYMFLKDGRPALFDPSPLYGDREFDIGITTVFGGFTDEFYQRYNEIYPLDQGYELRLEFYRLYLYMVHMVKFGNTYAQSTDRTIDRIINYRRD